MTISIRHRTKRERGHGRRVALRIGIALLIIVVAMCVLVPIISPYAPNDFVADPLQPPSLSYPFGTDDFGRDVFVRVWAGGRLDLVIAAVVVGISLMIGTFIGVLAGMTRSRWLDSGLMRLVDAVVAFPFVILILALIVIVGQGRGFWVLAPGAPAVIVAFIIVKWTLYARLARGQSFALRDRDFVTATRMLGYSQTRIIRRHLLPTVIRTTGSFAVADVIIVIVTTASLAFLGAGIEAPTAEWGSIMYEGRALLATAWWITVMPGVVLALTGLAVSLIADSLLKVER